MWAECGLLVNGSGLISGQIIWADISRSGSYVGRLWADRRSISFWQMDLGRWIWADTWADTWADGKDDLADGSGLISGLISGLLCAQLYLGCYSVRGAN